MSQFLDWNPARGTWYESEDDGQGGINIATKADVEPALEKAKKKRHFDGGRNWGFKNDFWHYATIPATIELEMKQRFGVDLHDPKQTKEVLKVINKHYPKFKTTNLRHE